MNIAETALSAEGSVFSSGRLEPVAVVGIGCRFPGGANSAASYWDLLLEKRCGIIEVPADRWNIDAFYDADPDSVGRMRTRWGGFLAEDVYAFDPSFFDMSPREALSMDPQQRILLQVAYEAIQDGRSTIRDLQKSRTGVFVGISTGDFAVGQRHGRIMTDIFAGTGAAYSIAANRISHRFNFNGPSLAIDTACSSALVAIDQAVRNLSMGICDYALAGGVNCMLDPGAFIAFSNAKMLSPTGTIYSFDERANGFVRGEGCGLVLLRPLAKAVAAGDRIYGVIRQCMMNQDGHTPTITAPSGEAQHAMLLGLMECSDVDPLDVDYVEAHGTGTQVGDPIEATAIGRVFGQDRIERPVHIGSFKPNLGHLESASGVAGFVKALLSAQHGIVAPNYNFERPNPEIPFDALGIAVATEPTPYAPTRRPGLAAVNSFGFGGSNASVLIEAWRAPRHRSAPAGRPVEAGQPVVVPLSASNSAGLSLWAGRIADAMEEGGSVTGLSVGEIADHLANRRDHFGERAAILVEGDATDLRRKLRVLAEGDVSSVETSKGGPAIFTGRATPDRKFAYAFSGQGGQWWAMSRRLLAEEPVYRRAVDTVDEALRALTGWSTVEEMLRDQNISRINDADVTQASIFANQVGLFEVWKSRGLRPDYLVGHSFGEVAATYLAGVIDLDTAARLIYSRGQIPHHSTVPGGMAAIGLTVEQLLAFIPEGGSVSIGAFNGPIAQTITGAAQDVESVMAAISTEYPDALIRRLPMSFGWHSVLLDECEPWFRSAIGTVTCKDPRIPIISTVTGIFETRFDADYWWQNLRLPVSYTKAIGFALELGINAFLELGPHRTVTPLIRGIAQDAGASVVAVPSLDRTADDYFTLASSEAALFVAGVDSDAARSDTAAVDFVQKPWSNQRLHTLPAEAQRYLFEAPRHPLLGWRDGSPEPAWTNEFTLRGFRFLDHHRVGGDCLFPAVGYIEVMAAALRDQFGDGPVELRNLKLYEAMSIGEEDIVLLSTRFDPITGKIRISSQNRGSEDGWRLRAEAYGYSHRFILPQADFDPAALGAPDMEKRDFYEMTRKHGLDYGPTFRLVEKVWVPDDRRSLALVSTGDVRRPGYSAFPGMFDGVLQSGIVLDAKRSGAWVPGTAVVPIEEDGASYLLRLPVGARKVLVAAALTDDVIVEFTASENDWRGRYRVFDPQGRPLITIEDFETKALGGARSSSRTGASTASIYEERYEVAVPVPSQAASPMRWLVVAVDPAPLAPLVAAIEAGGGSVEFADLEPFQTMDTDTATEIVEAFCASGDTAAVLFSGAGVEVPGEDGDAEAVLAATSLVSDITIAIGQVFDRLRSGSHRPRLLIVTQDSRQVSGDGPMPLAGVVQAAILGAARTIMNECPEFVIRMVDVDAAALAQAGELLHLLEETNPELELLLRGASRWVPRLERRDAADLAPLKRTIVKADDRSNFAVTMSSPGVIDNIVLREAAMPQPKAGEIVVEVAAVGLNFRDIMAATSILPDEFDDERAWWRNLGLEFSGVVAALGEGVDTVAVGDRVMGMGKSYLRRFAVMPAFAAMPVPDDVDLESAATIPTAFITAHYALAHIGRLAAREKVLIHLGSGGVGLAAIQVARHIGAEILTTAGSDEKRAYLKGLGVEHVMNSRSLDFAEEVRQLTGGGVDVVLNALSGAGIDKGLECLAPFGRFVEIGKRDLADDKPIGLRSLYHNNSYSVIDLSTMVASRPALMRQLLDEVSDLLRRGIYRPLAATRFPVSRTVEAMRTLFKAQHIGKIVVTFDEPSAEVEMDLAADIALSANGSYLVTGGLRGFGVTIADWLSRKGAGRLILANRTGAPDEDAKPLLAAMAARGTDVVPVALDVSDAAAVRDVLGRHAADKPLRGIVHGAAVIEDGFLAQLDHAQIKRVLRPKVAGAWNLGLAANAIAAPLDFFVSFSSIAQLLGSQGQGNYTAANAVLNAFASYRRSRGQTASTVAWGVIGGTGFVSRSEALGNYLDSVGMRAVGADEAAESLGSMLRAASETLNFGSIDWAAVARTSPRAAANPRVLGLMGEQGGARSRIQTELAAAPRGEWEKLLAALIGREVGRVLKVEPSSLSDTRKLSELGLDSLSSFELKNRIEAQVNVDIPVAKFLQTPTIRGLAKVVAAAFEAKMKSTAAAQLRASSEAGAAGAEAEGTRFRPLSRQIAALALAGRPMTSAIVLDGLVLTGSAMSAGPGQAAEWQARLARLAAAQDALRLVAQPGASGAMEIELGEPPVLADSVEPLAIPGPLWRFAAQPQADGRLRLDVQAHRAAADPASLALVIAAIAEGAADALAAPAFSQLAAATEPAAGTREHYRHLAYWREVLHRAPAQAAVPGRGRAPAPTGFGLNRGKLGRLEATIAFAALAASPVEQAETVLLAAWLRVLATYLGVGSLVVENHRSGRSADSAATAGPLQASSPLFVANLAGSTDETLARVRNALTFGRAHSQLDLAAIEAALEERLRRRGVALRQFGFAFVQGGSAASPAPWANEAQLVATPTPDGIVLAMNLDTAVFDEAWARRVLDGCVRELAGASGVPLSALKVAAAEWTEDGVSRASKPAPMSLATPRPKLMRDNEVPIYAAQSLLLRALLRPDVSPAYRRYWSLSRAFKIRPQINIARLTRSLDGLLARHESLRTRFEVDSDGSLRAFLDSHATLALTVEEFADEHTATDRAAFHEARPIDPLTEPVMEVVVLRFGSEGDIVVAKGHHIVLDGWSLGLLVEEMLQSYMGIPLPGTSMGIREYVQRFEHGEDPDFKDAQAKHLQELFRNPAPQVPNLGRRARGLDPLILPGEDALPAKSFFVVLDDQDTRRVRTKAKASGVTENLLINAAIAQAIAAQGGVDDVLLNVPSARRLDRRVENFVGWVSATALLRAPVASTPTLAGLAEKLGVSQDLALQYMPYRQVIMPGPERDEMVLSKGSYTNVFCGGSQTAERWAQGAMSSGIQRMDSSKEINLGQVKVSTIEHSNAWALTSFESEFRTFKAGKNIGFRIAYAEGGFDLAEVQALFAEMLDRLGVEHNPAEAALQRQEG